MTIPKVYRENSTEKKADEEETRQTPCKLGASYVQKKKKKKKKENKAEDVQSNPVIRKILHFLNFTDISPITHRKVKGLVGFMQWHLEVDLNNKTVRGSEQL